MVNWSKFKIIRIIWVPFGWIGILDCKLALCIPKSETFSLRWVGLCTAPFKVVPPKISKIHFHHLHNGLYSFSSNQNQKSPPIYFRRPLLTGYSTGWLVVRIPMSKLELPSDSRQHGPNGDRAARDDEEEGDGEARRSEAAGRVGSRDDSDDVADASADCFDRLPHQEEEE